VDLMIIGNNSNGYCKHIFGLPNELRNCI